MPFCEEKEYSFKRINLKLIFVVLVLIYVIKLNQVLIKKHSGFVMVKTSDMNFSSAGIKYTTKTIKNLTLTKPECLHKTHFSGRVPVNLTTDTADAINRMFNTTVSNGGMYKPNNCSSKQRVAIIIPFRDREEHLKITLRHLHPFLQQQQLQYSIFVIEMDKHLEFNRAILMNIGFVEAMKLANYTCFVFHDVDLLPEDNRIPYFCAKMPQHMAVAMDKFNYLPIYDGYFGGVSSMRTEHFRKINGFSNMFFAWGGEDDDLYERVKLSNLTIVRPSVTIARYKMIKHNQEKENPDRFCLLRGIRERMRQDGLSSLMYTVKAFEYRPLYTWFLVQVNETKQFRAYLNQNCKMQSEETKTANLSVSKTTL